ncbi:phospholipase D-like domain-containing protein [Methylobacterium sp. J-090]|uniref:phospholipase D-like domain-containing protein n=1 Tax=Methylobacterium sp. J-090 TaxID=2836666 RepID=UPI001FBA68AC|nr:phospholipase D-like domain-containing protein [Methylobacterium sp. J-090]MCJ2080219.1 phospholipase D-like domain-containing protein [Methylobacterium sp. J-090]
MEQALLRWIGDVLSIRSEVFTALGLALSFVVTVHVLLRKREVGGAIGWIGLAWLSPVFGAGLYALFGVNRVTRRAHKLRIRPTQQAGSAVSPDDVLTPPPLPEAFRPLDHAVRQITRLPLRPSNAVTLFRNGDAAYPVMLAAIAAARTSVALSSYIFRDDATGRAFCDALAAAKARGVSVRVIIDGIGGGYFLPGITRRLHRAGVPVGRFMHSALPWRMPFLNMRSHKKLLIVDGRTAFTGGLNIADGNRVAEAPPHPIRDTHFRLDGPVVDQLTAAFASDWIFVMGEDLAGEDWFPSLTPAGSIPARVVTSGPDADLRKIELVILQAVACATHSIRLSTPYFLPNEVLTSALCLAANRGIRVDVIIPKVSDHRFVDWATRAHVEPLLRNGVRIWLDAPPFDHSKLLVVDETWCFIGSANWDMRSFRLNFEVNVELYDPRLAAELDAVMRAKMEVRLTREHLAARALPVRLRDAGVRLALPYL